ncbi:MAG: deoxyribodipyrimidine photo-lyase, partial [Anaerolineae bacterium]
EGLKETQRALRDRGIQLIVRVKPPVDAVAEFATKAALIVVDRGYLREERAWRDRVARRVSCPLVQVESDVVVPVETVSPKEEYAAYTIRPKIHTYLDTFLVPLEVALLQRDSLGLAVGGMEISDVGALLRRLRVNRGAGRVDTFQGGSSEAETLLGDFVSRKLSCYADGRSDPGEDWLSHMSPYLHFGHISPLEIALRVRRAEQVGQDNKDAYLEELIVRRELSMNLCFYNSHYDSMACLPDWARETLEEHADDRREYVYDEAALEAGRTHDPYWNAAQREMVLTGKMHGYMRMYWGKKILEWMPHPEEAFRVALELNNRYELDGRDPNGFAGVAWCFGKHDRAWAEREIYGKIRTMTARGLERKFDMEAYVRRVGRLSKSQDQEEVA